MNIRKGKVRFKKFQILLDSGSSYTIIMGRLIKNLTTKREYVMQWHMQAGKITKNSKVKVDFTLPELIAIKIVTWNYHVDDSAKVMYDMILGRYI